MTTRVTSQYEGRPLFDIVSYGRRGPGQRGGLSREQIEQIARTVNRTPEVVVKVLPKDSNNAKSVQNHIDYIGRRGELELEGDDGSTLQGKEIGKDISDKTKDLVNKPSDPKPPTTPDPKPESK